MKKILKRIFWVTVEIVAIIPFSIIMGVKGFGKYFAKAFKDNFDVIANIKQYVK